MEKLKDMPKLHSPFVRDPKTFKVTPKINKGYEWVFVDPEVICVEKLDGINVSILIKNKKIVGLNNRKNPKPFNTLDSNIYINGVREAQRKNHFPLKNGQYFGELMGKKIQKNFLELENVEWFPFKYLRNNFNYRCYRDIVNSCVIKSVKYYPQLRSDELFKAISNWFKNDIYSLVYANLHKGAKKQPEGVIFYHPSTGNMAKLRLNMFDWWKGEAHKPQ